MGNLDEQAVSISRGMLVETSHGGQFCNARIDETEANSGDNIIPEQARRSAVDYCDTEGSKARESVTFPHVVEGHTQR